MELAILGVLPIAAEMEKLVEDIAEDHGDAMLLMAASPSEAREQLSELRQKKGRLALVITDADFPETDENGLEFLATLDDEMWLRPHGQILLANQIDLMGVLQAMADPRGNRRLIGKPWDREDVQWAVREELTRYVFATELNPLDYLADLDYAETCRQLYEGMRVAE